LNAVFATSHRTQALHCNAAHVRITSSFCWSRKKLPVDLL